MNINLSQFVGKKVTATLRNGEVIIGWVSVAMGVTWPYQLGYRTFTVDGHNRVNDEPTDIIHIELAEKPMKKYEQLEKQIAQLQKEVERLKEKEERQDKLPSGFHRHKCLDFLETKDLHLLNFAFIWSGTPQGQSYWSKISKGIQPLTDADIMQIQKWVIMSYEQEFGK